LSHRFKRLTSTLEKRSTGEISRKISGELESATVAVGISAMLLFVMRLFFGL
jgi:hypothetical protein